MKISKPVFYIAVVCAVFSYLSVATGAEKEEGGKPASRLPVKSKQVDENSLSFVGPGGWVEWRNKNEAKIAEINYNNHCSACHGVKGDGDGQAASNLDVPPRDHTDSEYMKTRTDPQLLNVVLNGGEAEGLSQEMPPHNTVMTEREARELVKHMRVLCRCEYVQEP